MTTLTLCPCCSKPVAPSPLCASCAELKGEELERAVIRLLGKHGAKEVCPLPQEIQRNLDTFRRFGRGHGPDGVLGIDGAGRQAGGWLVLEVKGTDNRPSELQDLRQLDEWVYLCSPHERPMRQIRIGTPGIRILDNSDWLPVRGVLVMNSSVKEAPQWRPDPFADKKIKLYAELHELCLVRWADLLKIGPPEALPSALLRTMFFTTGPFKTVQG